MARTKKKPAMQVFFDTLEANDEMCQDTLYHVFLAFMTAYGEPDDCMNPPIELESYRDAWGEIAPAPADCRCGGCSTYNAFVRCEVDGMSD